MADHDSFIGPYDAYAVEEQVVHGALPDAPLGEVAPGAKVFVRYADVSDVPAPPADATFVVDQRVVQNIMPGSPDVRAGAHDLVGEPRRGDRSVGRRARHREVRMKPPF